MKNQKGIFNANFKQGKYNWSIIKTIDLYTTHGIIYSKGIQVLKEGEGLDMNIANLKLLRDGLFL